MIDTTVTLAIIVSLCALISAPITAVINNRYQLKLRELELKADEKKHHFDVVYEKKLHAYSSLMAAASEIDIASHKSQSAIMAASHSASLLCDDGTLYLLNEFTQSLSSNLSHAKDLIPEISNSFNRELKELSTTK